MIVDIQDRGEAMQRIFNCVTFILQLETKYLMRHLCTKYSMCIMLEIVLII